MPKRLPDDLGKWMAGVDRKLSALASSRLDNASLDGSTLYIKDDDGNIRDRLGRQPDGSFGNVVVKVEPPPQPTAAILTAGDLVGTCMARWDGGTFDGRAVPLVFGYCEVWAEYVGEDWSPTVAPGETAERVGSIRDRTGGEVLVAMPRAGTWAVWLRLMGADLSTVGPWSPVATVEIEALVDTEQIRADLDEARERLEAAEQDLEQGMADRAAEIAHLQVTVIPGLEQTLADAQQEFNTRQSVLETNLGNLDQAQDELAQNLALGLDHVYDQAEARAQELASNAVVQAASAAQSEYDRLQELAERALASAGGNLIEDPGFDTDYWPDRLANTQSIVRRLSTGEGSGHQGGTGSALVVNSGSNPGHAHRFTDHIEVEPGQVWRMQIRYRIATTANEDNRPSSGMAFRFYLGLDGSTASHGGGFPESNFQSIWHSAENRPASQWRMAQIVYEVPEGVSTIQSQLRVWGSAPGVDIAFDTAEFRDITAAYESLQVAEAAREAAEAAQAKAGDAELVAEQALNSANAKSRVYSSTSAPSGTASDGDLWYRWSSTAADRRLLGIWVRESGTWRSMGTLDSTLIPLLDIGAGTFGQLDGDRMSLQSLTAAHVAIGAWGDLIPDPRFETDWWRSTGGNRHAVSEGRIVQFTPSSLGSFFTQRYDAVPGAKYVLEFDSRRSGSPSGDTYQVWARGLTRSGGWVRAVSQVLHNFSTTSQETTILEVEIPASSDVEVWEIEWRFTGMSSNWVRFLNPTLRRKVGGVVIDENGIRSPQVDIIELFSNSAVIDQLFARTADFFSATIAEAIIGGVNIADDAVNARTVNVDELFGATAVIQKIYNDIVMSRLVQAEGIITEDMIATESITTPKLAVTDTMAAALGEFLELRAGVFASNDITAMRILAAQILGGELLIGANGGSSTGSGGVRIGLDSDGGVMRLYNENGFVSGRLGGAQNFLGGNLTLQAPEVDGGQAVNFHVDGDITARSIALEGEVRVGGDGEGALVPIGDGRVGLRGRMPLSAGAANDMFNYDLSPSITIGQTSANMSRTGFTIGYNQPAPMGNRGPLVTTYLLSDAPRALVAASTHSASASGFSGHITSIHDGSGGTGHPNQAWIRFLAVWRD